MEKELLNKMIEEGYVNVNKHSQADIYIYNYANKTQFERMWNNITKKCRGLIMDKDFNLICHPFEKFFNLEELENSGEIIPGEKFEVYEKMDGSLGILYWIDEKPHIATRGSFTSEQAIKGTQILHEKYSHLFDRLDKDKTYLFEIIYPENRIVVDYGPKEDLVLLAIRHTETGEDLILEDIGFPLVKRYDGINDFRKLKELEEDNKEGFVIKFKSGFRMKIKFEEYKRLHRILTNISNKSIWEILSTNGSFDELIAKVPDEFYDWLMKTKNELISKYKEIEKECKDTYKPQEEFESRKEFAEYVKKQKYPHILFKMNDDKDYTDYLWKLIKPEYSKPFKIDE